MLIFYDHRRSRFAGKCTQTPNSENKWEGIFVLRKKNEGAEGMWSRVVTAEMDRKFQKLIRRSAELCTATATEEVETWHTFR